eukprot:TCONS_00036925-protein
MEYDKIGCLESEIAKKELQHFVDYNLYRKQMKWNRQHYFGFYATANGYHALKNKPLEGIPVRCVREPHNRHDNNAIRIFGLTEDNERKAIGTMARKSCELVSPSIDNAKISHMTA